MIRLDAVDHRILFELQRNARIKNKELATRIGLSESACLERVKRLEASGVIRAYRAIIDAGAVGARFDAWVDVTLECGARDAIDDFVSHLHRAQIVLSAHRLARSREYMLHVVAKSGAAWDEFLRDAHEVGLRLTVSRMSVVTDCVKARQPLPIGTQV